MNNLASSRPTTGTIIRSPLGSTLLVAAVYGLLVMAMWLPYASLSGMSYDTTFSQWSETRSVWSGFFFQGDPLRTAGS